MDVTIGKLVHRIRWDHGSLRLENRYFDKQGLLKHPFSGPTRHGTSHLATKAECLRLFGNNPGRFTHAAQGHLTVGVDQLGQLAVFDAAGALVCMFRLWKEQVAAWMPDGTRFGPPALSGGPTTPNALRSTLPTMPR